MQRHAVKLTIVTDALGTKPRAGSFSPSRSRRLTAATVVSLALAIAGDDALARPNTHAPSISTWDPRASSVVLGYGAAVSGEGGFTHASYNANFSSTNGLLSAQFGAHYVTYKGTDVGPTARGFSAGGVALFSLPLAELHDNGVPRSAFAFYLGVVPTALFSGQLNFVSVPLVLGVGVPFSPTRSITLRPWVELSPGFNFDTRIQEVSTEAAIEAAMDGTLTRAEVEELVEEGLNISQETTVGKRAGLSFAVHLGERVDIDMNLVIGEGHASAVGLGGALVVRWDAMVASLARDEQRLEDMDCAAIQERFRSCSSRRGLTRPRPPAAGKPRPLPGASTKARVRPQTRDAARVKPPRPAAARPAPARGAQVPGAAPKVRKKRPAASPAPPPPPAPQPAKKPKVDELPPLQAAPPKPR